MEEAVKSVPIEVFVDIETYGDPKGLTEEQRDYINRRGGLNKRPMANGESPLETLALHPLTGKTIAIGMSVGNTGSVFYHDPNTATTVNPPVYAAEIGEDKSPFHLIPYNDEARILEVFWSALETILKTGGSKVVTWRGRDFDVPFLMIRSAICGVRPTADLMGNRFDLFGSHIDAADLMFQYGAVSATNFGFTCERTGVPSSKGDLTGGGVAKAYEDGEYIRIARYCAGDTHSGHALWRKIVRPYFYEPQIQRKTRR